MEKENKAEHYIIKIKLDPDVLASLSSQTKYESEIAIRDFLDGNYFNPKEIKNKGPYMLLLSLTEDRLILTLQAKSDLEPDNRSNNPKIYAFSMVPFKRIIKDYFLICESYQQAVQKSGPAQIEAIDMGRRGLHDEGSELLISRMEQKITMDFPTARKLFTLICSLKWKGTDISSGN